MEQTFIFANYKFNILLKDTSINIKIQDTNTIEIYEGSVNENDIYIRPISKFNKLLVNALNKISGFNINLVKIDNKIKCKLQYTGDFVEVEEVFLLNQMNDNKIIEYHLRQEIEQLKNKNNLLQEKIIEQNKIYTQIYSQLKKVGDKNSDFQNFAKNCCFGICNLDKTHSSYSTELLIWQEKVKTYINSICNDDSEYIVFDSVTPNGRSNSIKASITAYITNKGKIFQQFGYTNQQRYVLWDLETGLNKPILEMMCHFLIPRKFDSGYQIVMDTNTWGDYKPILYMWNLHLGSANKIHGFKN